MATISIADIDSLKENGIVKIWWWKKENEGLNQRLISNEALWNILTAKQIYKLATDQEIEVDDKIIIDRFTNID